jgi:hypothetical protein
MCATTKTGLAATVKPCKDHCEKHADHCFNCNRPLTADGECPRGCGVDSDADDESEES